MEEDPPDTLLSGQMSVEKEKDVEKPPNYYNNKSFGPYKVFINSKSDKESNYISPILIGKILINGKVKGIKEIKKLGRRKITVEFENGILANAFIQSKIKELDNFNVYIPQHLMSSTGVVMIRMLVTRKLWRIFLSMTGKLSKCVDSTRELSVTRESSTNHLHGWLLLLTELPYPSLLRYTKTTWNSKHLQDRLLFAIDVCITATLL